MWVFIVLHFQYSTGMELVQQLVYIALFSMGSTLFVVGVVAVAMRVLSEDAGEG